MYLAVATAINNEYKIVQSCLSQIETLTTYKEHGYKSCVGFINNVAIQLALTGMGPRATFSTCQAWLNPKTHFGVFNIGYCGGLRPEVQVGDVLVPRKISTGSLGNKPWQVCEEQFQDGLPSDWIQKQTDEFGARLLTGDLLTLERVVESKSEREELHYRTGAVAVDMEAALILREARTKGIPSLVLKIVLDDCETELRQLDHITVQQSLLQRLFPAVAKFLDDLWRRS